MRVLARLVIGAVVLAVAAAAVFVADIGWNESRLFYLFAGRDGLEASCRPALVDKLRADGFSPTDLTFDPHPTIGFLGATGSGATRSLDSAITFSDGPLGQRVDGRATCTVRGKAVEIEVEVDSLPRRLT